MVLQRSASQSSLPTPRYSIQDSILNDDNLQANEKWANNVCSTLDSSSHMWIECISDALRSLSNHRYSSRGNHLSKFVFFLARRRYTQWQSEIFDSTSKRAHTQKHSLTHYHSYSHTKTHRFHRKTCDKRTIENHVTAQGVFHPERIA